MPLLPPYSTTFISAFLQPAPATGSATYTVPAGRVAIITCQTAVKDVIGPFSWYLFGLVRPGPAINGYTWVAELPSTTQIQSALWNGHIVGEAGSIITVARGLATSSGRVNVAGYLLTV